MNVFHAAGRGPSNVVITCVRDRTRIHGYMLDVSGPALLYNSIFFYQRQFYFQRIYWGQVSVEPQHTWTLYQPNSRL